MADIIPFGRRVSRHAIKDPLWGSNNKVVDDADFLIPLFRGQFGQDERNIRTLSGSYTFSDAKAASEYALHPNDRLLANQQGFLEPKVFPVFLRMGNPLVVQEHPFLDLCDYAALFGASSLPRVALKFADYIESTDNWSDLAKTLGVRKVKDVVDQFSEYLPDLYFDLYHLLDDPDEVSLLTAAGCDGAIYGGSGATFDTLEYRVFSLDQVKPVFELLAA